MYIFNSHCLKIIINLPSKKNDEAYLHITLMLFFYKNCVSLLSLCNSWILLSLYNFVSKKHTGATFSNLQENKDDNIYKSEALKWKDINTC